MGSVALVGSVRVGTVVWVAPVARCSVLVVSAVMVRWVPVVAAVLVVLAVPAVASGLVSVVPVVPAVPVALVMGVPVGLVAPAGCWAVMVVPSVMVGLARSAF
ncbi:hypothetical protein TM48_05357 [Mycobacterium shottsii]|uniref:Uncharacterized protein n=1 Tax=Mycobacterium shottsii TaxID=133549 RepID=A0A7I7L6W9_9MYCO|nr:hypothetical protein TM48_05357 [Mycobacterium shottsii]BBX55179.1 hypothetical protein MSHO_05240 [Mycobacterium shottsii]